MLYIRGRGEGKAQMEGSFPCSAIVKSKDKKGLFFFVCYFKLPFFVVGRGLTPPTSYNG